MNRDYADYIDALDFRNILLGIVNQAIEDYVKLQHPMTRTKKYLQEHYLTAVDFLFDNEYRLCYLDNGTDEDMSVLDLLSELLETDSPDIKKLQKYAIEQTVKYWGTKKLAVLDHIPETICVGGEVFDIHQAHIKGYSIDWSNHIIQMDKANNDRNHRTLLEALLFIMSDQQNYNIKAATVRSLSNDIYLLLKTNNFFSYIGAKENLDKE